MGETVAMVADQFINGDDHDPWIAWAFLQGIHEETIRKNAVLKNENAQLQAQLQRCESRLALFQAEAMYDVIGSVTGKGEIPRRHFRQFAKDTSLQRK